MNCEAVAVRGADEAIDLLIRTFCQPGADKIMICPPTYAMYEFCADSIAVEPVKVPLLEDFQLDMAAIVEQLPETKILFLCSPNNPTGNVINQVDIISLLEASKESTLVVVDEAYIEFAPETSVVSLIEQYPNLVVIRTLSKAFGLAAIRCGFLLADSSVMEYISRLIAPYPIADPIAEIALRALESDGVTQMRSQSDELISTREWFIEEVQKLAIVEKVYMSATNFVLIRFTGADCIYTYLLSKGIVTRNQAHELHWRIVSEYRSVQKKQYARNLKCVKRILLEGFCNEENYQLGMLGNCTCCCHLRKCAGSAAETSTTGIGLYLSSF